MTTFKNNIVLVYRQQSIIEWCDALDIRVINGRFCHTKKYIYVYIHTNILVDATTITRIASDCTSAHFRLQYYLLINFRLAGTRLNVTLGNVIPRFEIVFQDVSRRVFHNVNMITHRSNYPSIIIYTHIYDTNLR